MSAGKVTNILNILTNTIQSHLYLLITTAKSQVLSSKINVLFIIQFPSVSYQKKSVYFIAASRHDVDSSSKY